MDVCRLSPKKVSQISQKISASFRISGIRPFRNRRLRHVVPRAGRLGDLHHWLGRRPRALASGKRLQKKELERSTMWKMGKIH